MAWCIAHVSGVVRGGDLRLGARPLALLPFPGPRGDRHLRADGGLVGLPDDIPFRTRGRPGRRHDQFGRQPWWFRRTLYHRLAETAERIVYRRDALSGRVPGIRGRAHPDAEA